MSDRVIRDEILTSERYWSVSIEAQRLFVHLLLVADNLGRFSGKNYTLRAACFPGQAVAPEKLEKMLAELHDADLVRIYEIEKQRYIFIPRFRQHLRYTKHSLYPEPPKEINDIFLDAHGEHRERTGSAPRKRSEEKRREEKKNISAFALPDWIPHDSWEAWLEVRKKSKAPNTDRALGLAVKELERLRGEGQDVRAVLEQSTLRGWKGVFEVKGRAAVPNESGERI